MPQEEEENDKTVGKKKSTPVSDGAVRPSTSLTLIRHAESRNNEVYRNARYIYKGGTPDFDLVGWKHYVSLHRSADPGLSDIGERQANHLAQFLVPHLTHQASQVRVITSPMKRTLETIRPTLQGLQLQQQQQAAQVLVHGFYFESEGCHDNDTALEGMTPHEIQALFNHQSPSSSSSNIQFVGFPDPHRGWYCHGTGAETRAEAETRAAKFYTWLCEELDQELLSDDVFDAGVAIPGEEGENEHDKLAPRQRRRRTTLLIGHGDFMSLVLKRFVAGFGHAVETHNVPHRSAFVHFNTGMTELEYFGKGRFLIMSQNQTPHFAPEEYSELRTGGSLKDGWSYLMPNDEFVLDAEVSVAFSDELEDHVREQTEALKALYLSSEESDKLHADSNLSVEAEEEEEDTTDDKDHVKHFIVKRGLQVVGVATYSDKTGRLTDVAVRPSAGQEASETLFNSVKEYSRKLGRSGSLLVLPRSDESKALFEQMGFKVAVDSDEDSKQMELKH